MFESISDLIKHCMENDTTVITSEDVREDRVATAFDDDGYPICDCWESELGGFDLNTCDSCAACVKYDSQDCKEPLAHILKELGVACGEFLSVRDNEKALDVAYEDISKTYVRSSIDDLKVTVNATIEALRVTALSKVRKDVNDALDLAIQALNLAQTALR